VHEAVADPLAAHPRQVQLCGPPGTVAIFNAHLWHAACLNRSGGDRPNVTSFWRRRVGTGAMAAPALPAAAMARLPAATRFLQIGREVPG
jgi:ectoine hydroxylase-related dioxygenase (phytanoyl-CoA dioxygenase family)